MSSNENFQQDLKAECKALPGKRLCHTSERPSSSVKQPKIDEDSTSNCDNSNELLLANTQSFPIQQSAAIIHSSITKDEKGNFFFANYHFDAIYKIGVKLGSGSFGDVYAAVRRHDSVPVAVKTLTKIERWLGDEGEPQMIIPAEIMLHQKAAHDNPVFVRLFTEDF